MIILYIHMNYTAKTSLTCKYFRFFAWGAQKPFNKSNTHLDMWHNLDRLRHRRNRRRYPRQRQCKLPHRVERKRLLSHRTADNFHRRDFENYPHHRFHRLRHRCRRYHCHYPRRPPRDRRRRLRPKCFLRDKNLRRQHRHRRQERSRKLRPKGTRS